MPEAVIVATARTPIGRARRGSLVGLRGDDLAATVVAAALAKVPELADTPIDDLMLGCGMPGGEQGYNMARVVALLLGQDELPGTTVTRYCSSSLQTTRMAMHAIRAGEGDVFISAGVETVSSFAQGHQRRAARHPQPALRRGPERAAEQATIEASADTGWTDPRGARRAARRVHRDGVDCGERRGREGQPRGPGRVRGALPEPRREGDEQRVLGPRDHGDNPPGRHGGRPATTAPVPARPCGRLGPGAGVPARRHGDRGQRVPAQRRRGGPRGHERHQGARTRHHPTGPDRLHRRDRSLARRSWASGRWRPPARRWPGRA